MNSSNFERSALRARRSVYPMALLTFLLFVFFQVAGCDQESEVEKETRRESTAAAPTEKAEDAVDSPSATEEQEVDSLQVAEETGGGSVEFVETVYDFGKLRWNTDVAHSFKFRNVGDEPLKITRVRSCCPPIVGKATSELIEPGGTGSVEVTFITKGIIGEQHKAVYVHTSDPENEVVMLEIIGELTVDFIVRPPRVNFGRLVPGKSHTQKIHLIAKDLRNLEVRKIDVPVDYMSVTAEPYHGKKGIGVEVTVTLLPDAPNRFIDEEIQITTNSEEKPVVGIQVLAWWE